jgi:hypothetical protein
MLKYKDKYFVTRQKDSNNKPSSNKDDTYIKCKKNNKQYIQIYRYNSDTLAVLFWSNGVANNRVKELSDQGIILKLISSGDDESIYLFSETYLANVAKVVGARERTKRELTEEQREVLRERMASIRSNKT